MEQGGDYMENKIARGLHGVFGAAADEAKHANKHIKGAAKSARESVKIGRPFEGKGEVVKAPSKLSWVGGAAPEPVKEKHPMVSMAIVVRMEEGRGWGDARREGQGRGEGCWRT